MTRPARKTGRWSRELFSPGAAMLTDLLNNHLDGGYSAAARRRAETGPPTKAEQTRHRVASAVAAVVVGLVLVTAYNETVANAPQAARTRQVLLTDIRQGNAGAQALDRQAQALREQISAGRSSRRTNDTEGSQLASQLKQLEAGTGLGAVSGPGVVVTVTDGDQTRDTTNNLWRVQDTDLQGVVNALWSIGAEAVAVDGQRLSPVSTIRAAGGAILVDLEPVSSPYEVTAIGDPKLLPQGFNRSAAAVQLRSYNRQYGITLKVAAADSLNLPAAMSPNLRYAQPVGSPPGGK
ncbi:DUF881 domain-containing protein [Fodinicola acaciae]|uniref:DUF881 domain-containing protein n=1 Tax=Fodinicola acaciae TaxID=2681555 RepID=UPI0013D5FF3C|nr:DUF881 domain-containing protein [Fodinicola acaciae]